MCLPLQESESGQESAIPVALLLRKIVLEAEREVKKPSSLRRVAERSEAGRSMEERIAYDSLRASLRSVARMHGDRDRSKAT